MQLKRSAEVMLENGMEGQMKAANKTWNKKTLVGGLLGLSL